MSMTEDEAISLLCLAKGEATDQVKKAAKTALLQAMHMILDSSGVGWDFEKVKLTLTTISGQTTYYLNRLEDMVNIAAASILNPTDDLVSVVHNAWYGTQRLQKMDVDDFLTEHQGSTFTGVPTTITVYGNTIEIYPIPNGAYTVPFLVSKHPKGFEAMLSRKQYAPVFLARQLMFEPNTPDYLKSSQLADKAMEAFKQGDGVLDMNDAVEGDFIYEME
jgi:hypothetical protein